MKFRTCRKYYLLVIAGVLVASACIPAAHVGLRVMPNRSMEQALLTSENIVKELGGVQKALRPEFYSADHESLTIRPFQLKEDTSIDIAIVVKKGSPYIEINFSDGGSTSLSETGKAKLSQLYAAIAKNFDGENICISSGERHLRPLISGYRLCDSDEQNGKSGKSGTD